MISQTSKDLTRVKDWVTFLLLVAPIVFFYFISIKYTVNIPWFDDFESISNFLLNWVHADSISGKIESLIRPHNEHRVLTARLLVLVQYWVSGHTNFRALTFLGNLSVFGILAVIAVNFRRSNRNLVWLLPTVPFLFNLQYYAMTTMTIMSMQYQMVIFLSFLSLYFLSKGTKVALMISLLIAILDSFSMGNGMMVWPSGVILLLFRFQRSTFVIWCISAIFSIFFYFHGHDFVQGNDEAFGYILANPVKVLVGSLAMLGGIFDIVPPISFSKRMVIPVIAGFTITVFLLLIVSLALIRLYKPHSKLYQKFSSTFPYISLERMEAKEFSFWISALAYLFISMILVVFFRTRFNFELVLWSTYKIYPGTFAAITFLLFIRVYTGRKPSVFLWLAYALALITCVSSYWYYIPEVETTRLGRIAYAFNQRMNGIGLSATKGTTFETMIQEILQESEDRGFYKIPVPTIHPDESRIIRGEIARSFQYDSLIKTEENTLIKLRLPSPLNLANKGGNTFALLRSDTNLYAFPFVNQVAYCLTSTMYSGNYAVELWVIEGTQSKWASTNKSIEIK